MFEMPAKLLLAKHPAPEKSHALVGLSVKKIIETGNAPIIEMGLVEKTGQHGGIGAGI